MRNQVRRLMEKRPGHGGEGERKDGGGGKEEREGPNLKDGRRVKLKRVIADGDGGRLERVKLDKKQNKSFSVWLFGI